MGEISNIHEKEIQQGPTKKDQAVRLVNQILVDPCRLVPFEFSVKPKVSPN
jgi:hypothetical protein